MGFYEYGAFTSLVNIRELDLSYNRFNFVTKHMFTNLLKLKYLNLAGNLLSVVSMIAFAEAKSLSRLSLYGSGIETLNFNIRSTIQSLDLRGNAFNLTAEMEPFSTTPDLSVLRIGHPNLTYYSRTFTGASQLKELVLENYNPPSLSMDVLVPVAPTLENLSVVKGDVESVHLQRLPSLVKFSLFNLPRLTRIFLSSAVISDINSLRLQNLPALRNLTLDKLPLSHLDISFLNGSMGVTNFRFSLGGLANLQPSYLKCVPDAKSVDLSFNRITFVEPNSIAKLRLLAVLDLTGNLLSRVENSFLVSESLSELILSKNFISAVEKSAFARLPRLRKVDLSSNEIAAIGRVDSTSLATVNLASNPWHCDCKLMKVFRNITSYSHSCSAKPTPIMKCFKCAQPTRLLGKSFAQLTEYCEMVDGRSRKSDEAPHVANAKLIVVVAVAGALLLLLLLALVLWKVVRRKRPVSASFSNQSNQAADGSTVDTVTYARVPEETLGSDTQCDSVALKSPDSAALEPML